jgi:hypothetical protein
MKKKLLIYWVTRTFVEMIDPLIPKLGENFRITVVLYNYSTLPGLIERLKELKGQGYIEGYAVTPDYREVLKFHLFWRSKIKELKVSKFDYCLSTGEIQVGERYLMECVLPEKCLVVCMNLNVTHLSINTQRDFGGVLPEFDSANNILTRRRGLFAVIKAVFLKFMSTLKKGRFLEKVGLAFRIFSTFLNKKIKFYFDRYFFPWFIAGRVFRYGAFDVLTEFSSGRSDALIFFDEVDAEAHRKVLKGQKIYVAQSPNKGNCRCEKISTRGKIVLSPMSGFIGVNYIDEKWMELFCRDYKTVLAQTGANKLHLRLHPDESGDWSYRLQEYLVDRGIDASVVGCEKPIREVICDYIGFVGFSSSAFKDARASCDYTFVVGFEAVSNYIFVDPKYNYGNSEGITWIEKDGSFDPDIFVRKKFVPPKRKSVPELLMELSK